MMFYVFIEESGFVNRQINYESERIFSLVSLKHILPTGQSVSLVMMVLQSSEF